MTLPKRKLGKLEASIQGLGCMGMSEFYGETNQEESLKTLEKAFIEGINFFDTANAYGFGANEELLSTFMANHKRNELVIATKCGIVRDKKDPTKRGINNTPNYILQCCEKSLKRLNTDYVDLYYLHRVDEKTPNTGAPLEESMKGFAELLKQGKIHHVGLSETTAEQTRRAHLALLKYTNGEHGLTALQSEYSLLTRTPEKNGVLKTCQELGIGFVAYSPLSRQLLTDSLKNAQVEFAKDDFRGSLPRFSGENLAKNLSVAEKLRKFAENKGCSVTQLALAWVIAQGDYIVPIPGTKRIKYLLENISASNITLTKQELEEINKIAPIGIASGERYTATSMAMYNFEE